MKKQIYLAFALCGLFLVGCGDKDDPKPSPEPILKGKIAITITETLSSLEVEAAYAMESATTAVITIEKDGVALESFNNKEISLSHVEDYVMTQEFEFEVGTDYALTKLQLKNADDKVTFATPLTGSELASAVEASLPIAFEIKADLTEKLDLEVICTLENDVTQFGYASFNVTDKTE